MTAPARLLPPDAPAYAAVPRPRAVPGSNGLLRIVLAVTCLVLLAVLLADRPREIAAAWVASGALCALAVLGAAALRRGLLLTLVALSAAAVLWSPDGLAPLAGATAPVAATALAVCLPTGVLRTPARRLTLGAVAAVSAVLGLAGVAADHVPSTAELAGATVLGALAGVPFLLHRHSTSSTAARQRIQLVLAAALAVAAVAAVEVVARVVAAADALPVAALVTAAVLLPLSVAAGEVDAVRRQAGSVLVAGAGAVALALAVVAGEVAAVLVLGRVPAARERNLVLAATVGTMLAVLAFPPLLARASRAARWAVQGSRRSPADVLETFAERASRGVGLDELLLQLAESLRRTMALERVEVWVGDGTRLERTVAVPHRRTTSGGVHAAGGSRPDDRTLTGADVGVLSRAGVAGEGWLSLWLPRLLDHLAPPAGATLRVAPAVDDGRVVGLVVAQRATEEERFAEADERALADVARRLAVVLHNRQLGSALESTLADLQRTNAELVASRSRLVAAADAERRRIERDIHDGAQQHLVALAVTLGLARDLLTEDPEAVAGLLDDMVADVRATIAEVRDLAHGIYPALLKEAGLEEALRAAAARSPLQVAVSAREAGRHGPDTEAAVYFCCMEALQNAAKHAPGSSVEVRAWRDAGLFRFEVADDGPGYDPATVLTGHGLQNMADRLGAIGGSVRWESAPGAGTRVVGVVPVSAPPVDGGKS